MWNCPMRVSVKIFPCDWSKLVSQSNSRQKCEWMESDVDIYTICHKLKPSQLTHLLARAEHSLTCVLTCMYVFMIDLMFTVPSKCCVSDVSSHSRISNCLYKWVACCISHHLCMLLQNSRWKIDVFFKECFSDFHIFFFLIPTCYEERLACTAYLHHGCPDQWSLYNLYDQKAWLSS